ncbi:MAG: transporter [Pseudobdellovibrio sp.]|nr:transporter [Pseudobdellovibrio sp.]
MTYVAIPYQIYDLTKSSFWVGILGSIQLVPLLIFGLMGGVVADSMNRRKIIIRAEILLAIASAILCLNAFVPSPQVWLVFVIAATMSALNGFHRPAMEALTPQIVEPEHLTQIAALNSFKFSFCAISGPALSGFIIAHYGLKTIYFLDFLSFAGSIYFLYQVKVPDFKPLSEMTNTWQSIKEGLRYALSRAELVGTYLVDILAMIFAMPMALYPAMAANWGGAKAAGWLYAAIPAGSLVISLFSGWTQKIHRRGAAVILAATAWGVAIVALAFAHSLELAFICLAFAGAFDMISAVFRSAIWNETIPASRRGRLASIEMLSYMSGPMLGNARAGYVASLSSNFVSILSGGIICIAATLSCIWLLPKFWSYSSTHTKKETES